MFDRDRDEGRIIVMFSQIGVNICITMLSAIYCHRIRACSKQVTHVACLSDTLWWNTFVLVDILVQKSNLNAYLIYYINSVWIRYLLVNRLKECPSDLWNPCFIFYIHVFLLKRHPCSAYHFTGFHVFNKPNTKYCVTRIRCCDLEIDLFYNKHTFNIHTLNYRWIGLEAEAY